ncbi:hypothetical protein BX600DRAFT_200653 [Xylariales sp. PMI_506]|nr:hypothetical protein BX600DRAFT_200653 [Xylariales sp. PMI_506]
MNSELSSNDSSSAAPATPTNSRKERGAIAAQACENCRQRKQRCSEERPKCATCLRMKLECKYREPQPTKKDKTLVEILERLKSLEGNIKDLDGKVDNIGAKGVPVSMYGPGFAPPMQFQSSLSVTLDSIRTSPWPSSNIDISSSISSIPETRLQYGIAPGAYKMLTWPFIQQFFKSAAHSSLPIDWTSLQHDGSIIMRGIQNRILSLPLDTLDTVDLRQDLSALDVPLTGMLAGSPVNSLTLGWETVQRLSKTFFETFNLLYPIVDRQAYHSLVLPSIATHGFNLGIDSTLTYLILALGEVGLAAAQGSSISVHKGLGGGIKGGTLERPPGLRLFNEARKRMGFNLTECSVENVQIFALAALYYETCSRHTEFWRMMNSASLACQALLTSKPEELTSPRAELIKRIFWHCSITETYVKPNIGYIKLISGLDVTNLFTSRCRYLNIEFNIPLTGLDRFEDLVGMPDFRPGLFSDEDYACNQASHYQEHFSSQIFLRKLSSEFQTTLATASTNVNTPHMSANEHGQPPIITTLKQYAVQLEQWRGLLPAVLGWEDRHTDTVSFVTQAAYNEATYVQPMQEIHVNVIPTFTTDLHAAAIQYSYVTDIQIAILRSRYSYAKYLIYRAFVFKALHHPEKMTHEDAEGVAMCLRSILLWPITMSPVRNRKRLIPCLFFWSQNILTILLILQLSQQVPILIRIRTDFLGNQFDLEAQETTRLCIDWIRDLKEMDATALWCWTILGTFYTLDA